MTPSSIWQSVADQKHHAGVQNFRWHWCSSFRRRRRLQLLSRSGNAWCCHWPAGRRRALQSLLCSLLLPLFLVYVLHMGGLPGNSVRAVAAIPSTCLENTLVLCPLVPEKSCRPLGPRSIFLLPRKVYSVALSRLFAQAPDWPIPGPASWR